MTFARKVYLQLPTPSPADLRADRERVLEAFHADSMTLSAMQTLYPTLKKFPHAAGREAVSAFQDFCLTHGQWNAMKNPE